MPIPFYDPNRPGGKAIDAIRSPQTRPIFVQAVLIILGIGVVWLGGMALLSLLNAWVFVLLTAVLAVAVYVRGAKAKLREARVDANHCAACGYDLDAVESRVCPECGRDATRDEPTWRRLRREHEAKYGKPDPHAAAAGADVDEATVQRLLAKARAAEYEL